MVWQILIALLGMAALIVGVITMLYLVSFLVLRGVSLLFPLSGRRPRKKER
jgi:hypothetical protein